MQAGYRFRPGVFGLAAACLLAGPAITAEPKPDAARSHVIFMGVDLAVQRDDQAYRVEDVVGSEFKIRINRKEFFVPTRNRTTRLKVTNSLKLAAESVRLDDLHGEEGYTPANDPRRKFNARVGAGSALQAAQGVSETRLGEAQESLAKAQQGPREFQKQYENIIDQEKSNLGTINQQMGSSYGSIPDMANELQDELAKKNFDLVEVSFKVSSPVELTQPYMVVLVEFQPRDAKPGETSLLIHAKALDPIDAQPRSVLVREGGLPTGFKLVRYEVHLYDRGREVATNTASKRVELTRAEAQLYLVVEYLGAHKHATLPAAPVAGTLPLAQRRRLTVDQLNQVFYARVTKDGSLAGLYRDEACTRPLDDAATLAAAGEVFFQPALDQGKPVEGTARVRLGEI